jgi:DNA repair and recombination protein RAD54 and RAD54-like protein
MLRRLPTTTDGKVVDRLQESTRVNKPFKPPAIAAQQERNNSLRKRKRVSYKGAQDENADSDDDGRKKKKKRGDVDECEPVDNTHKFPVF